jgi:hypothetical protein
MCRQHWITALVVGTTNPGGGWRTRAAQHWITALVLGITLGRAGPALGEAWRVDLEVKNGAAVRDTITFGIHPLATPGIDGPLGEIELPPWPPSSLFEVRFPISGTEGVKLDLRDTTSTLRVHTIRWQAGTGGYPVTVRWNRLALPNATLIIKDGYGGVFIPPISMYSVDSLRVQPSQSFIKLLTLEVTPGTGPANPILADFPPATIFLGQRFSDYRLDDYVNDPDTPDSLLLWNIAGNQALFIELANRILRVSAPPGWTGTEVIRLTVRDPQWRTDQTDVAFTVKPGGLPQWAVPLVVRNAAHEEQTVEFGIHPDAGDGIDLDLGELSLPPWPPQSLFESRLELPDQLTWSRKDLRRSTGNPTEYHLQWQAGDGGYPVTVSWPADLPDAQFTIQDDLAGTFVPPTDMRSTQSLVIPAGWSFITGLAIRCVPVVDTIAPAPPQNLRIADWSAWHWVRLEWDSVTDDQFGFYEVLFDTTAFAGDARYSWDWSEDAALSNASTGSTTIQPLPVPCSRLVFGVRAWDRYGNASPVSNRVEVSIPSGIEAGPEMTRGIGLGVLPNPSTGPCSLRIRLDGPTGAILGMYGIDGRLVREWRWEKSAVTPTSLAWDGCGREGRLLAPGVYFARLSSGGRSAAIRLIRIR